MVVNLTNKDFQETIENNNLVMVDFWAPWCGPCKMLGPTIDAIATENKDTNVVIAKVNVDEEPELATQYGIRGIPCVLFFKNGENIEHEKLTGNLPKNNYISKIEKLK